MSATVAELDIVFNAQDGQAMAAFGGLQDQLFRTAIAGKNIGGFFLDAFTSSIGSAIDLETEMNNVNSIAKVSQGQIAEWTDDVQALAVQWGQGSVDTAAGMYQIQSAGFSASDAIDILASSSTAARAGLSTVEVASDAVTSVLKAYESQLGSTSQAYRALTTNGERAEYVQNVLFRGVDRGKMTYDQLSGAIGNSIATSATAGISIEEMVGSMALMTQQGLSASEASTALNNTMLAFINPSDKMEEAVSALGYESALTMLRTEGLAGSMTLLEKYTGGSADKIAELFTNIRSRRGAMLLMNGDLAGMIDLMSQAQGGAGKLSAMQSALEEQTKSTSFAIDVIKASFEVAGQEMVQAFLPVIRQLAFSISSLAQLFIALPQPIKTFVGASIGFFGAMMSGVGALALFLALLGPILGKLFLLASGIGVVSIAAAALFAVFTKFGFRDVIQGFSDMVDALDVPFLDHFTNSIERAAEAYHRFTGLMQVGTGFVQLDGFARSIGALGAAVIAFADSTSDIDFLDGPLGKLGDFLKDIAVPLQNAIDLYDRLKGEGKKSDTTSDFGVADVFDDGDFKQTYSNIRILRKVWDNFSDDLYKTFPKQRELIGQVDTAVSSLLAGIESVSMGNWDQAWAQFKESAQAGWEIVKTVSQNIRDAFNNIDWQSVYDSVGSALDGIWVEFTDLAGRFANWTIFTAVPAIGGWLVDHADDAWDAIKGLAGWTVDRAVETVGWIIDVLAPGVEGTGKQIMSNVKGWLIGQIGAGRAPGAGANYGISGTNELQDLDLGSLIATWAVDIAIPKVKGTGAGIINNVKSWLIGKMGGGGSVPSPGLGTGIGSSSTMSDIDLGTVAATWSINVLEPKIAGWVSGAASWLRDKLQGYVDGSVGGAQAFDETGGVGMGGSGSVRLANWFIDVLEPFVNMTGIDIHSAVQREIDFVASAAKFSFKGFTLVLQQITGEQIESFSDIPAAIQVFIDNTQREYHKTVDLITDVRMLFGGISFDGPTGSISGAQAFDETGGVGGPSKGRVQQFFESSLFGNGGDEFYHDVSVIMNYEVTNAPGDALEIIRGIRETVEKPVTWIKEIHLDLKMIIPDVPDFLSDFADAIDAAGPLAPPQLQTLSDAIHLWEDLTKAANDAADAQAHSLAQIGAIPSTGVSAVGGAPPDPMAGGMFAPQTNFVRDTREPAVPTAAGNDLIRSLPTAAQEAGDAVARGWDAGAVRLTAAVQQTGNQVVKQFSTDLQPLPRQVFTSAQDTSRQFGTGLVGMGDAATDQSGAATRNMGTGLLGMAATAGSNAAGAVGSFGTGIAPLPGAAETAGSGADASLRSGIAPMAAGGGAAARNTSSAVQGGLAPMPGTVGGIANSTGQSFNRGIGQGFSQAASAARNGAAAISAAANSIGNLFGTGYAVGSSLGEGVAAGIYSQVGAVQAAAAALASASYVGAAAKGEISSPSRMMAREIGVPLAQGVIVGMESQRDKVQQAFGNLIEGGGNTSYTLPRSKVVAIYNTHQYVLEPEEWLQVQRDSKMSATQLRDMNARSRQLVRSKPRTG